MHPFVRPVGATLLLAAAALALVPPGESAQYPDVYCWDGIAGSECGVDTGNCDVRSGYNVVTEQSYTEAACAQTPVGPCAAGVRSDTGLGVSCLP